MSAPLPGVLPPAPNAPRWLVRVVGDEVRLTRCTLAHVRAHSHAEAVSIAEVLLRDGGRVAGLEHTARKGGAA